MEHTVLIWSKRKETGKMFLIENRIKLSQEQIEELALKQYMDFHGTNDEREYWAELEETKHK